MGIIVICIIIEVENVGIDRVFESQPVIQELQGTEEAADVAHVLNVHVFFVQNLDTVMESKLVSTTDIVGAVRFIGSIGRPLENSPRNDIRSGVGSRDLMVFHITYTAVSANLEPLVDLMTDFGAEVDLVHLVGPYDTLMMTGTCTDIEMCFLAASGKGNISCIEMTDLGDSPHPVIVFHIAERIDNVLFIVLVSNLIPVLTVVIVDSFVI